MNKMRRHRFYWLVLLIVSAILSVLSIPGIILAHLYGERILFFVCLVILIYAMYGMHFVYVSYRRCAWVCRMLNAIHCEQLRSVEEISTKLCREPEKVARDIESCLRKHCLDGYEFDGTCLHTKEK